MDPDYHSLQSASARFNLPTQTIDQVYGLHATVSAESMRIANDTSLDPAHKVLALAGLAQQTRSQVKTALGNEIGTAYLNTSMQWLNRMASGYAVSFPATGYINTFTSVVPKTNAPSVAPTAPVTSPAK